MTADRIEGGHPGEAGVIPDFYEYYATRSQSEAAVRRARAVQSTVLRVAAQAGLAAQLDVADVGCGIGVQSRVWAERGHRVRGVDADPALLRLARVRTGEAGLAIQFEAGSSAALPWADRSADVCLLCDVIQCVENWRSCLTEAARVLRPGGLLYLSTTNVLCPRQQEFKLPLYSWYPAALKRFFERLAVTTNPELSGYARYPAIHWFTFYRLRDFLAPLGFRCMDRFALIDPAGRSLAARALIHLLRNLPFLRILGHMATPGTLLVAVKTRPSAHIE